MILDLLMVPAVVAGLVVILWVATRLELFVAPVELTDTAARPESLEIEPLAG